MKLKRMKIKTIDHVSGTFVNYADVVQHFDVVLVSYIPESAFSTVIEDNKYFTVESKIVMGVGTAFCKAKNSPDDIGDTYDPELGKKIALAHATSDKAFATINQSEMGFIDASIRAAILTNIANNIKEEPERYSYCYKRDKERYLKFKELQDLRESLTNDEMFVINFISTASDEEINKLNLLLEVD